MRKFLMKRVNSINNNTTTTITWYIQEKKYFLIPRDWITDSSNKYINYNIIT